MSDIGDTSSAGWSSTGCSTVRHNRDPRLCYFCSTDLSLSTRQALNYYYERRGCEVVNWHITEKLGWADCQVWHVESVKKYLVMLRLALAYLDVRKPKLMLLTTWPTSFACVARSMSGGCLKKPVASYCEPVIFGQSSPDTHWLPPEPDYSAHHDHVAALPGGGLFQAEHLRSA
jgi:hypothetical protein